MLNKLEIIGFHYLTICLRILSYKSTDLQQHLKLYFCQYENQVYKVAHFCSRIQLIEIHKLLL